MIVQNLAVGVGKQ